MCFNKYKGVEGLQEILESFDIARSEKTSITEDSIGETFKETCADKILRGYFLINNEYILDVKSIELYYHEENGPIKDHIMYHTSEHYPNEKVRVGDNGLPYFELGTLNFHQSGVDITFEKENEYRASFLIREYRILKKTVSVLNLEHKYDIHSTHIFDDVFYLGIPVSGQLDIKWVPCEEFKDKKIEQTTRYNVAQYEEFTDEQGNHEFRKIISKTSKEGFFKAGKDKYYKQCPRKWRFRRED